MKTAQEDETAVLLADLERVVRRMPNFDRQVFLARRLDDLSYAEIALRTGVSVADVEQAISRAMCTIDRELALAAAVVALVVLKSAVRLASKCPASLCLSVIAR